MECKYCKNSIDPKVPICQSCHKRIPFDYRLPKEEFCKLYSEQNMNCEHIAQLFGVSTIYALRLKKRYGVSNNPSNRRTNLGVILGPRKRIEKTISKEDFQRLYLEEKKSMTEIAEIYGVTRQTIYKYREQYEVKTRTMTEHSNYHLNGNFFASWNPNMAWVLGLVITDGCISQGASALSLFYGCADEEVVVKIRAALESNHPIRRIEPYGYSKKTQFHLSIGNKKLIEDLLRLGVTPKKSLTVNCPQVPDNMFRHFLRGVYEGDGTASGGRFKIISGSENFIRTLKERIARLLNVESERVQVYVDSPKKTPYYTVCVAATDALMKLYRFIYEGVKEPQYLIRKKVMFEKLLQEKLDGKGYRATLNDSGATNQIVQDNIKFYDSQKADQTNR